MSEERVVCTEVNFHQSKKRKDKSSKQRACPWHMITLFLGVLCLLFLVGVIILGYKNFQASHKCQNNEIQEYENSSIHEENVCFSKVPLNTEKSKEVFKNKWSCCEKKCYYFSHEYKTFEESKKFCFDMGSHLVKIENKKEKEFIQSLASYFHWIGLSRKRFSSSWTWEDGSLMNKDLFLQDSNVKTNCAYTSSTKVAAAPCTREYFLICEKNSPN